MIEANCLNHSSHDFFITGGIIMPSIESVINKWNNDDSNS